MLMLIEGLKGETFDIIMQRKLQYRDEITKQKQNIFNNIKKVKKTTARKST